MKKERQIVFYKEYFIDFYTSQELNVQEKIDYVFRIIKTADRVPEKFLKHLEGTNGLYEIKVEYQSNINRIFCCFDEGNVVVLFNAFQKKSQKTPAEEIRLATTLKKDYFKLKTNKDGKGKNQNG